jgi:Domain of unknown function (DUF5703)
MKKQFNIGLYFLLLVICIAVSVNSFGQAFELSNYNIVWNSQSKNSAESMPCGGGDIGLNVWVENGDLLIYIDRSGNIDENDQQLKSGRVRVKLNPDPFHGNYSFRQELKLEEGLVEIRVQNGNQKSLIKVWVEVMHPVIHIDVNAELPVSVQASYENWRNTKRIIPRTLKSNGKKDDWDYNRWSMFGYFWYDGKVFSYPDTISFENKNSVLFYHRNSNDLIFDKEVNLMKLGEHRSELVHPTKNRIFGGIMSGDGMTTGTINEGVYAKTPFKSWALHSEKPSRSHHIRIFLNTSQSQSLNEWQAQLNKSVEESKGKDAENLNANLEWWKEFWNRSFVIINPEQKDSLNLPWQIGRNFQLFRYQQACNVNGEWPTKFNGGLFTFDPVNVDNKKASPDFYNPDFRAWGAWTAQNQRLVYWPMLKNGDFDAILPQFEYYRRNLPNAIARTKYAWNIDGCSFCEQIGTGGLPLGSHYGWEPPFGKRSPKKETGLSDLHATYYTTQLEFAYIIHEYYRFTGKDISKYIPFLKEAVIFHFEYFKMLQQRRNGNPFDENGLLVIDPSHALETYHGKNATDVICALRKNLECLLALPEKWVSKEEKKRFDEWMKRLPPINFRMHEGHITISPLEGNPTDISNYEAPQLYTVFPWPVFGIGKPDLQVAIDTWHFGLDPWKQGRKASDSLWYPARDYWFGWTQQAIWLARLGLTDEAKNYIIRKMSDARGNNEYNSSSRMRFPSFWGPGFDWTPDHNWGGSGMIAVQEMLMQTSDSSIYLFPAWPKEWDVHFKLHAPDKTIVEAEMKNGKIELLSIIPESRKKDVKISIK